MDELARRGLGIRDLGEALAENHDHLRRKLYGQTWASLRDVHAWAEFVRRSSSEHGEQHGH